MSNLVIYTDGGYCIPKEVGGWGMVITLDEEVVETKHDIVKDSTSNRMEMTAFINALKYTDAPITIITDSNYVVQGYNSWLKGWKAKGWKKADGKPILNMDLWMEIDSLIRENVTVQWIKGHAGHKFNELVDSLTRGYE